MASRNRSALRPRKQPSQARSRATVGVILEAAARVFATRGYAASTTNHIAATAGVSVGSLYEYFPNKDALLVSLVERHIDEAAAHLAVVAERVLTPQTDLMGAVGALVQAMMDLHAQAPRLHQVLFEEAPLPPHVRERLAALEQTMAEHIAAWLRERADVRVPDPRLAATVLVQTIDALTHRLVIHSADDDRTAQTEEMVALATAYLTADRARDEIRYRSHHGRT